MRPRSFHYLLLSFIKRAVTLLPYAQFPRPPLASLANVMPSLTRCVAEGWSWGFVSMPSQKRRLGHLYNKIHETSALALLEMFLDDTTQLGKGCRTLIISPQQSALQ
ncbi:hypothetical protein AB0H92_06820 [Streptomyces phaeochromogenes]|uniref:hypothetical protein n=1 Tax=Streptomyces phaeochromogenes TaxID=1923 RepID=UPI0033F961E0